MLHTLLIEGDRRTIHGIRHWLKQLRTLFAQGSDVPSDHILTRDKASEEIALSPRGDLTGNQRVFQMVVLALAARSIVAKTEESPETEEPSAWPALPQQCN